MCRSEGIVSDRAPWIVAVALLLWATPLAAEPQGDARIQVGVVSCSDEAPFREVAQGFRRGLTRSGFEVQWVDYTFRRQDDAEEAFRTLAAQGASLVFALGSTAAAAALRCDCSVPVLASMVDSREEFGTEGRATGVFLEFPAKTELELIRQALPRHPKLAVLFSSDANRRRVESAAAEAKRLGITLLPTPVGEPRDLPRALDDLAGRADAIWAMADPIVYTAETAKPFLVFSFRNRIPLVGFSRAWAKAGAVLAFDRDFGDIGEQCAEIAAGLLRGEKTPASPPAPPRKTAWAVNRRSAEMLGITLPDDVVRSASETYP
jgi:putative ABC transport system substrate-binding protein